MDEVKDAFTACTVQVSNSGKMNIHRHLYLPVPSLLVAATAALRACSRHRG